MEQTRGTKTAQRTPKLSLGGQSGCYVYCIAPSSEEVILGPLGIESSQVHTVAYRDLCAVVHFCPARPYETRNQEVGATWVQAHHRIVEAAWQRWGVILPMTFNTVIAPGEQGAAQTVRGWLEQEAHVLHAKLQTLTGKAEYGVQVFWDTAVIAKKVALESETLRQLEVAARSPSPGLAYMYRQRVERLLRQEMAAKASEEFQAIYSRFSRCTDGVQVGKTAGAEEGRPMIANLSCLVVAERYQEFEALAAELSQGEGIFVRLVGALPPYSFC